MPGIRPVFPRRLCKHWLHEVIHSSFKLSDMSFKCHFKTWHSSQRLGYITNVSNYVLLQGGQILIIFMQITRLSWEIKIPNESFWIPKGLGREKKKYMFKCFLSVYRSVTYNTINYTYIIDSLREKKRDFLNSAEIFHIKAIIIFSQFMQSHVILILLDLGLVVSWTYQLLH